jgi:hypothetical protein
MSEVIDSLVSVEVDWVIKNLYQAFNVDSDRGLSLILGLSVSAVRNAKLRNSIPWEGVCLACRNKGISVDAILGIEVTNHFDKVHREKPDVPPPLGVDDLIAANALVDKVLDDELFNKNLPADRELFVYKKLRPLLIKAVFEHNFNEVIVKVIAQGALHMA